jgi:hypothetical protein
MCVFGNNNASRGQAPTIAPEPTRPGVVAAAATDTESAIAKSKATAAKRLGVFGNLSTTPMGDASYGTKVATFGKAA